MAWCGRWACLFLVASAAAAGPGKNADHDAPPPRQVLDEARQILANCRHTQYSHETHVDEAEGEYDVDCSGLLCLVLKDVLPRHLKVVPPSRRHGRPLALQFFETVTAARDDDRGTDGWRHVVRLADARPGDVIVWRLPEQKPGHDTGHVMIVEDPPAPDGDHLFRVGVINDSCESPPRPRRAAQTG